MKLVACYLLCFTFIHAADTNEKTSKEVAKLPELQADPVTKQLKSFDYGINIKPIIPRSGSLLPFKGKSLLVFFFAVNCGHCKQAAPHIEKLARELSPQGLNFVAVATKKSPEKKIPEFMKNRGLTIPIFYDYKRDFSKAYGAGTVPILLLINKKGHYFRLSKFKAKFTPSSVKKLYNNQSNFQDK
jgi:thiol-disulfide isomerase/thioredoxin